MGRQITKWVAEDGTEFNDQRSMILHELESIDEREIALFLDTIYECGPKRRGEYVKVLTAWQKYIREHGTNIAQKVTVIEPIENEVDIDQIFAEQEAQAKEDPHFPFPDLEEESDDWIMQGAQKL